MPEPLFIAQAPALKTVLSVAQKAAPTSASILIEGESGTGKTLLAKWIHLHSGRAAEPRVTIDCAGIPEALLESELFGHEKGAFTDALSQKDGMLERAQSGTVVFENLTDMPLSLQGKILRVVEERTFMRLGGQRTLKIKARIIACAGASLQAMRKAGRFRDDLYFRLAVIPLHLPPLRERPEDIGPLAEHFLQSWKHSADTPAVRFHPAVIPLFKSHLWPGNVREMENLIAQAALKATAPELFPSDFPLLSLLEESEAIELGRAANLSLKEMQMLYVEKIIADSGGNIARAARRLGITRKSIYDKRRRFRDES